MIHNQIFLAQLVCALLVSNIRLSSPHTPAATPLPQLTRSQRDFSSGDCRLGRMQYLCLARVITMGDLTLSFGLTPCSGNIQLSCWFVSGGLCCHWFLSELLYRVHIISGLYRGHLLGRNLGGGQQSLSGNSCPSWSFQGPFLRGSTLQDGIVREGNKWLHCPSQFQHTFHQEAWLAGHRWLGLLPVLQGLNISQCFF